MTPIRHRGIQIVALALKQLDGRIDGRIARQTGAVIRQFRHVERCQEAIVLHLACPRLSTQGSAIRASHFFRPSAVGGDIEAIVLHTKPELAVVRTHQVFILAYIVEGNLTTRQGEQRTQILEGLQEIAVGHIGIHQEILREGIVQTDGEIALDGGENVFHIHRKKRIVERLLDGGVLAKHLIECLSLDVSTHPCQGIARIIIKVFSADGLHHLVHGIEETLNHRVLDERFGVHQHPSLLEVGGNEILDVFQLDIARKPHAKRSAPLVRHGTEIDDGCQVVAFGFHLGKLGERMKALSFLLSHQGEQGSLHARRIAARGLEKKEGAVVERTERTAHLCPPASAFFAQRRGDGFLFEHFEQGFHLPFVGHFGKHRQGFGMRGGEEIHLVVERKARFGRLVDDAFRQLCGISLESSLDECLQLGHGLFARFAVQSGFLRHFIHFHTQHHRCILRNGVGVFRLRATCRKKQ